MSKKIITKLVGVTFGVRQTNIRKVQDGQRLTWMHEVENQYDSNAILVFLDREKQFELGHLNRMIAAEVVASLKEGKQVSVSALQKTGGVDNKNYGVNVVVEIE